MEFRHVEDILQHSVVPPPSAFISTVMRPTPSRKRRKPYQLSPSRPLCYSMSFVLIPALSTYSELHFASLALRLLYNVPVPFACDTSDSRAPVCVTEPSLVASLSTRHRFGTPPRASFGAQTRSRRSFSIPFCLSHFFLPFPAEILPASNSHGLGSVQRIGGGRSGERAGRRADPASVWNVL